jgi:hypothetical protein
MKLFSAAVSEETVSVVRDETQMGIAINIHNLLTRGWVANTTPPAASPQKRDSFLIVQVAGWASEPVWAGTENPSPPPIWGSNQGNSSIRVVAPQPRNLRKMKYLNKGSR